MDNRLACASNEYGVTYTRYADDMAFSAESIPAGFSGIVDACIADSGFLVNPKKRVLIVDGRRKIIAGVDVSSGKMRAPREFRREVRQQAHLAIKLGATEYIIKNRQNHNALPELLGRLAYWLQVEPENSFAKMAFGEIRGMLKSGT
jgi:RNA-directed DNA polymerase